MTEEKLRESQCLQNKIKSLKNFLKYIEKRDVEIICNYHSSFVADKPVAIMIRAYYKDQLEAAEKEFAEL